MLQMVKKYFYVATLLLLMCGCDKIELKGLVMPTGDVVNSRFEQSVNMHSNKPVACVNAAESYVFYVCTVWYVTCFCCTSFYCSYMCCCFGGVAYCTC